MTVTLDKNQTSIKNLSLSTTIKSLNDLESANVENPIQSSKQPTTPIQEPAIHDDQNQSSQETPVTSFRFGVRPASKLKQALESLTDAKFNPKGLGLIEVVENGLEITVRNTKTGVAGHLWFKSSGLINFEFKKAMINKMIDLNCVLDNLVDASANDIVTLHYLHGCSHLNFMFGNASPRHFAVDLLEMDASFEKFPNITFACDAVILSEQFRDIIQAFQDIEKPRIGSLEISDKVFTVSVGKRDWRLMYEKVNGIRGMAPNMVHQAWLRLHHRESLKKASFIAAGLLLCLVTDPFEQIMLRFNLRELGDLVFISRAEYIIFDVNGSPGLHLLASAASLM
ncbi:uncharacterized protein LOC110708464 [Chenopodium quinoa]|uniref:uncharacterized protein LOC110708464 n=1 Tax=Chenopodium quinoa TaxID=63459 RepID=UPI000B798818|nr:uncharacterized protein LOC110708464 [Chenopodium quinoa]